MAAITQIVNRGTSMFSSAIRTTSNTGGFSRLKGIFSSGQNYSSYEQIVTTAKNKILGNIPNEILQIIIKKHPNQKGTIIKGVQESFGKTVDILKKIETCEIEALKNLSTRDDEILFLLQELYPSLNIPPLSSSSLAKIDDAGKYLSQELKKSLSIDCNCSLEFIGNGQFGNAYKLTMTDNLGQSIMHDRVIKVFKSTEQNAELIALRERKFQELLPKYSDDELYEVYKNIPYKPTGNIKINRSEEAKKRAFMDFLIGQRFIYANKNLNNAEELFANRCRNAARDHGIFAEANTTFRLKNILGHNISRTDAVATDMFDLERGYSIMQYSDGLLPQIQSKINYEKLGLIVGDINTKNKVAGRLIDFGGIVHSDSRLFDKTVLKYYKKIMNRANMKERMELITRYEQMAENIHTPHYDKIRTALGISYPIYGCKYNVLPLGSIDTYG